MFDARQHHNQPMLRLSPELHLHITSFLSTTEATPSEPHVRQFTALTHASNKASTYQVRTTDPAVLWLRSTNTYFRSLIAATQTLLLDIERGIKYKNVLACSVCLRLRAIEYFALAPHEGSQIAFRQFGERAKYRFCITCGFRACSGPHPARSLRSKDVREQLTTYAPGTKVLFPGGVGRERGAIWVWCLDCRILKKGVQAGSMDCRLFCKACCERMVCAVEQVVGCKELPWKIHRRYKGLAKGAEHGIRKENKRPATEASEVALRCSLLVRKHAGSEYCDEGDGNEGEEEEELDEKTREEWFDSNKDEILPSSTFRALSRKFMAVEGCEF